MWALVRRGGCLATVGVALGACTVQASIEVASKAAISSVAPDIRLAAILTLMVALPTLVLVSYLAARIRPGASIVMTALVLIAVVVQLVVKEGQTIPFWNAIAALFIGPSATFAGGVLFLRK
jgi:hypothetical protein